LNLDPYSRRLFFFFILLLLSALFSASETAFFSVNKILHKKLKSENSHAARRVIRLLVHPRRLLITILISNTLVNVTAASIAAMMVLQFCETIGIDVNVAILINVVTTTFLILIIGEITPKLLAIKHPDRLAKNLSLFIAGAYIVLFPVSILFDKLMELLTTIFRFKEHEKERLLDVDEFHTLLEIGEEQGALEEDEKEMLHSIFEFGDTSVREIMIPRTDVVCVPDDVTFDELIGVIKKLGHTRIPVYSETIDAIQGILNAKDLLPLISQSVSDFNILKLVRPAIYVPESKKIDDLLRLFQKQRQHMAIVVDEYGGTSGIVTLEDIIEEIVGEIHDEYDNEPSLFRKIDESTYVINAKIDIESLNELINIAIPETDGYDTLGGFVLEQTGALPLEKETIRHGDYVLTMEKVEKNRIVLVRVQHQPVVVETEYDPEN
jgi:putative hemolysin